MADAGQFDPKKAQTAKLPAIARQSQDEQYQGTRGYLLAAARAELVKRGISEQELNSGGLRITTTFDPKMQTAAEKAVKDNMPTDDAKGLHVGLAAVEPGTGAVRAIYGGKDYLKQPFNDATQAAFQPGSSFKAFSLAAMLKDDIGLRATFTGNTIYYPDGSKVRNEFNRNYGPAVNMLYATEQSINTAFVDMTQTIGPEKVVDAAVAAGVPRDPKNLEAVPVVTLGVAAETPLTMANAYATFAAQGKRAESHTIAIVKTRAGKTRLAVDPETKQTIDVDVTRDVTYALEQVVNRGTGTAALALNRPAAGKTGTHEDLTAWFVGYTPQLSTSVGFYRVDAKGKRESLDNVAGMSTFFGGAVPTRMWTDFMKLALVGKPVKDFDDPVWTGGRPTSTATARPSATSTPSTTPSPSVTPTPTATPTTRRPNRPRRPNRRKTAEPTQTPEPSVTTRPTQTTSPRATATPRRTAAEAAAGTG